MNTTYHLLARRGSINPTSLSDYQAAGGYQALCDWLTRRTPEQFVNEVKESGLLGRGGAWFPTGKKFEMARATGRTAVMVCNADEGEPGTCKDRVLFEEDPHSVLEGLVLAAWAVGANRAYIYLRGEYSHLARRLQKVIAEAEAAHFLGKNILGTDYSLKLDLHLGAGAYICGEETALLNSVEGLRGEPRLRPPYPTNSGLFGQPTVINNVETLANLTAIAARGAAWFRSIGHPNCPGTKLFSLVGDVAKPGVVEVPTGVSLGQLIREAGGGVNGRWPIKFVQLGGACGGVLSVQKGLNLDDVLLEPASLQALGAGLGTGSVLVADATRCPVDIARSLARFFARESCGYCTPCREGSLQILCALDHLATGRSQPMDISVLDEVTRVMQASSRCALGQSAPVGIRGLLTQFAAEVAAHVEGRCPAAACPMWTEQPPVPEYMAKAVGAID